MSGARLDDELARRLPWMLALGAALLLATIPLGRVYDGGVLATVYGVALMALGCQAAEWWDSHHAAGGRAAVAEDGRLLPVGTGTASDVMRLVVLLLVVFFAFVGLSDLAAAASAGSVDPLATGSGRARTDLLAAGALVTGASALTLLLFAVGTQRIPGLRGLRARRPISWFALAVILQALAQNLTPASAAATVASTAATPQQASDLILGVLPFGLVALLVVGPAVRRGRRDWLERLGFLPLRLGGWVIGLAVGLVLVPLGDSLVSVLTRFEPGDCLAQQEKVAQSLAGLGGRGWCASVGVALAAGVCEELLFRGALQPRIGIVLSSMLWATYHLQYTCHGLPSVSNLYILLLGLVFGAVRARWGLAAAVLAHSAYDGSLLLGLTLRLPVAVAWIAVGMAVGLYRQRRSGGAEISSGVAAP